MPNDAMVRMQRLVLVLREMCQQIEPELHVVSGLARSEWRYLQAMWPSDSQLREGTAELNEEQLEEIVAKARRFTDIVHGLASNLRADMRLGSLDPISEPAFATET
jgi:hypothetical protein